jgi:mono/diheme cytochrome c family protein
MNNRICVLAMSIVLFLMAANGRTAAEKPTDPPRAKAAVPEIGKGKMVFDQWCLGCHARMGGPSGPFGFPPAGTNRLQQRYQGAVPAALEDRDDLKPDLIKTVVRQGMPIMPPLRKTEVTDAELDAVIAYLTQRKRN